MSRISGVVRYLVDDLLRRERLELVPGASPEALVEEILDRINSAPAFAQAGSTIALALIESELVIEVYAEDEEIVAALNYMVG